MWKPSSIKGWVLLTHGMAEHSSCYEKLAAHLASNGWGVWGWDFRGHGKSDGKRGFGRHLDDFQKDLAHFYNHVVVPMLQGKPLVMFAHSMGGLVTLRFLYEQKPNEVNAVVLSSPCIGLSVEVPQWKVVAAKVANQVAPQITMYNEIKYKDLSRDPQMQHDYRHDPYRHDKISPGIFLSMVEIFPQLKQDVSRGDYPLLMQLAGDDRIVSTPDSQELFNLWPNSDKKLHIYQENLHEVYNDLDKAKVIADLDHFLQKFAKG